MIAVNPATPLLGYCTNVHPAQTLAQLLANLRRYTGAVKRQISPRRPMPVGLWLPAGVATELSQPQCLERFRGFLSESGLLPFTLNGFPFGDFHQQRVKHQVYQPDWSDPRRLHYSRTLAHLLSQLLPAGSEGSISTLPIGWPNQGVDLTAAADQLCQLVADLALIEKETGRLIHFDLEPEPGCLVGDSTQLCEFFREFLLPASGKALGWLTGGSAAAEELLLRHLRVCHDICHAAVMFEDQADIFASYRELGIAVGKVQISAALVVNWVAMDAAQKAAAAEQLAGFAEERYLHQTMCSGASGGTQTAKGAVLFEDLPAALTAAGIAPGMAPLPTAGKSARRSQLLLQDQWRIHFHVPIYLENLGLLQSTQSEITRCFSLLAQGAATVHHFEVETYAWNVLPPALQQTNLAAGIAQEMRYAAEQVARLASEPQA